MGKFSVLVTGGAGFIDSHIVDALVEQGHDVRILDSLVEQVHAGKSRPRTVADATAELAARSLVT